jgi:hypothetical protein
MNDITFIEAPIAFGSSFNALYFPHRQALTRADVAALRGVARFLNSDIARHLYALFGKTRLLDRARFERNDLLDIPFPFSDCADRDLQSLEQLPEGEITQLFAKTIGLDSTFVQAVDEYAGFRWGYEDSQIPDSGLSPPIPDTVTSYRSMLQAQLSRSFGPEAQIDLSIVEPAAADRFARINIGIVRDHKERASTGSTDVAVIPLTGAFSPHASILYRPDLSRAIVSKPWTRVAWTIEQAYADARAISEEILRSGAAA